MNTFSLEYEWKTAQLCKLGSNSSILHFRMRKTIKAVLKAIQPQLILFLQGGQFSLWCASHW
jgi:hypothetical protein